MIHIATDCGFGNQLFFYAMARSIQLDTQEPIIMYDYHRNTASHVKRSLEKVISAGADVQFIDKAPDAKIFYKEIAPFRTFLFLALHKTYRTLFRVRDDNQQYRMESILQPVWNRLGFCIASLGYMPFHRYRWPKDYFLSGYFFSRRFWGDHAEEIRSELCRPDLISEKNADILDQIRSCNAVCVHIRLGDYVEVEEYRKFLYVCDESYYQKAITTACTDLRNPVFFIFTNDINTASSFHFPDNAKIIFMPEGNSAVEDMQLMAQCQHFIMSNSTYSWWGQFLSDNPSKKVYAPSQWYRMEKPVDFYESWWTKIPVDLPPL